MAISDKLTTLNGIKSDIKAAIIAKGGTATNDFTTYATAISNLPSGGGGSDDFKKLIDRSITSATIPSGTTTIGNYAFINCTSLTSVTIPNSVRSIGEKAFYCCFGLTSVTIPNTVTEIGQGAFGYCSGLTSITSLATKPPTIYNATFQNVPKTCPIYVPAESVEAYKAKQYWSARAAYIQAIPSANTLEFLYGRYNINYDLSDANGDTNNCGLVEVLYNGTAVDPSSLTVTCSPNYAVFNQVTVDIYDGETGEPTGETDSFYTFSTNQSTVGTYTCTASVTYQGLTATTTVDIDVTDSSQEPEPEQPVPEGLHEFTISQSNWPDCAMMVEAFYNPTKLREGERGSQTVNIYEDPNGEPVNTITYDSIEYGEMTVQNSDFNAGVYCTNSSDWTPYETGSQAFKLECRTDGTYYIEVVDHTDPKFYDANGNQIYPDNA